MATEGVVVAVRARHVHPWLRRLIVLALASVLLINIAYLVLNTPFWNYNGSRLMPSFAVSRGLNYYVPPYGGPLYCTVYGPLTSIVYLPATLFKTPNSAVLGGSLITVLLCFSAAAFTHFAGSGTSMQNWGAFLAASLLLCYLEPLRYSCFNIHADGPGLALGALSCATLYARGSRPALWILPISALTAMLAVFCKLTFLPLPLALTVYLLLAKGRGSAWRYVRWLLAAAAAMAASSALAAGPMRLYHCLIWVPAHQPWNTPSHLVSAAQAMRFWIRLSLPVIIPLLAGAGYLLSAGKLDRRTLRVLAGNRCVPLLMAGVALLPASIAGRAKIGGDINSYSFALFFLTCGLTVMLADTAAGASLAAIRRLAACALISIIIPLSISQAPLLFDLPSKVQQLHQTGQNVAFEYLQRHPGQAYFPWFPLSHYYAEHKFRHHAFGIADRLLAGEPVTSADFRAYVPQNPRLVAFGKDGAQDIFGYDLMSYLPQYSRHTYDPELPGWTVYERNDSR